MAETPKRKSGHQAPTQLCWSCQNAYADKCEWMKRCKPIEGWVAEPTVIRYHYKSKKKLYRINTKSFAISECPNFIPEERSVY